MSLEKQEVVQIREASAAVQRATGAGGGKDRDRHLGLWGQHADQGVVRRGLCTAAAASTSSTRWACSAPRSCVLPCCASPCSELRGDDALLRAAPRCHLASTRLGTFPATATHCPARSVPSRSAATVRHSDPAMAARPPCRLATAPTRVCPLCI